MRSKRLAMPFEEFEVMPVPFGWKAEYWDGQAHLSPREFCIRTRLQFGHREVKESGDLLPLDPRYKGHMVQAFFDVFRDSVEFCNWPMEQIQSHAEKNVHHYFQGVRGKPLPVSAMALDSDGDRVIGLALFVENREGLAELDLLFVLPSHQRRGIATQMVTCAANTLLEGGVRELRSAYHICNEVSRAWHYSYGFQEIPDPFYYRLKYSWYRQEIARKEKLGITEDLDILRREKDRWQAQLTEDWMD